MSKAREIVRGAIFALAAAAFMAGPAQADVAFSPPQTLVPPIAGNQEVAVDSSGRPTVVVLKAAPEGMTQVQVMRLSPSGLPETVYTLEEVPRDPPFGQCICPELAVDPSGRAIVAWETVIEGVRRVAAALIDADGVPQTPQILSPAGVKAGGAKVAANSEGSFALAWDVEGPEERLEVAVYDPEGNLGEAHLLTEPGEGGSFPDLAAGPDGTFHVAWAKGSQKGVSYARLDDEGVPGEAQTVSPEGEGGGTPRIVVDSKGRATIGWWRGSGFYEAKAVRLDADGTPGTVWTLQPPDQNVIGPELAVDGQDRVTAIWEDFQTRVFSVRIAADGTPGGVLQLSPEGHLAGSAQIAAAPDGRVFVVWNHPIRFFVPEESCGVTHLEPEDDVVRAALIGSNGQLAGVYDVSAYGEEAGGVHLALDPLGFPWVVWASYDGTYFCEDFSTRIQISHGFESQSPPVERSPAVLPGSEPEKAPPAVQLAKRGVAREGRVRIKARCSGEPGETCSGSIRLISPTSALLPRGATPRAREKATLTLASGRYRIAAGQTATLRLPVSRAARQLLAPWQPSWVSAKAEGRGLPAKSVLIRVLGTNP